MAYAPLHQIAGAQPFTELFTPDTTGGIAFLPNTAPDGRRLSPGMVMDAFDPYFGYGRFMYLKAGQAENPGGLVSVLDQTFTTATIPSTAILGLPFFVARQVMVQNSWGWYQFEGITPMQASGANLTAGAVIGIGTAGKAAINSAGKALVGAKLLQIQTYAPTKVGTTTNGSNIVQLSNVDGLFYGLTVSGTGLASTTINGIDANQRQITTVGSATANGTVTLTFLYTGFILAHIQCPVTQGPIT